MRHLKIYRAIRLIHRTGSIRKAAADLSISPSALNRSIQGFEDELTFEVFERLPGGVRLSDAGELLLDVIDRHLIEFHELQAQLGTLRDGEAGDLRISIGSDIAAGEVIDCVAEVEAQFSGLSVEIVQDNSTESLQKRQVHLALLTNPTTDDTTEVVGAWTTEIGAWQHTNDANFPAALWDIIDQRVLLPPEGTGSRTVISHVMRRNRLSVKRISTLSAPQMGAHVSAGNRIALMPEIAMGRDASANGLRRLPIKVGTLQVCALRMTSVPLVRPAQFFLVALQKRLDALTAS